jgi:excinuclease ABC subunit A
MVDEVLNLPENSRVMILAPVVSERKGEHVQLLQGLQAKGYIRARIDGELCELDDPPSLALRKKHTIEVVVDRFKVRDDLAQRLSESFENALNLSGALFILDEKLSRNSISVVFGNVNTFKFSVIIISNIFI